ncbi:MAG TPA: hypothetical protein VL025_08410 [Thermoanaerobaculia bacterium]|nr:hypothetical protein [Thermoanaerobaculia bacterium]
MTGRRRLADPILRALGADPEVFHPIYRAQKLILVRRARIVQSRRRGLMAGASPFRLLCLFATLYGFSFLAFVLSSRSPLLGSAAAVTIGCFFLLLVVITDNFDVLVDPRETLILAAHPHDERSFIVAKLAAIGRTLAILAVFLFGPSTIVLGVSEGSPAVGLAFLAGAAGASLATITFGMLAAAAILKVGGRNALNRLMPWLQGIFQIGYLLVVGTPRMTELTTTGSLADLGLLPWLLPSFWFLALVELALGLPAAPALGRLLLATGSLAFVLAGAIRWISVGLRERLLEPAVAQRPVRRRERRTASRAPVSEGGRLFALLRVHLRSDWRTRSEFLLMPVMGAFILLVYLPLQAKGGGSAGSVMVAYFYSWMLVLSADVLTRSSRPETLWFILASPIDRTRFSLATLSLVRAFQLAPLFAVAAFSVLRGNGTWPYRAALLLELLALGDLLVITGKAVFPDFPFSRLSKTQGGAGGERFALMLIGSVLAGLATAAVFALDLLGWEGALAGAALFALLRFPALHWARRRTATAASRMELVGSSVG